jgi:hypothetical protein
MTGVFKLEIALGNEAMQSPEDISDALQLAAKNMIDGGRVGGVIMDSNGNTVGSYGVHEAWGS